MYRTFAAHKLLEKHWFFSSQDKTQDSNKSVILLYVSLSTFHRKIIILNKQEASLENILKLNKQHLIRFFQFCSHED